MSNTIKHKRSSTPGAIPTTGVLDYAEIAINYSDGKIYTKNNNDKIINIGVTTISGEYINPASGYFSSGLSLANKLTLTNNSGDSNTEIYVDNTDGYLFIDPGTGREIQLLQNIYAPVDNITLGIDGQLAIDSTKAYVGLSNPTNLEVNGDVLADSFIGAGTGLTGTASSLIAGSVTNGVYITGAQSISGIKTFKDRIITDSGPLILYGSRQNEGNIHLSNTTCNYISFNASGVGIPDGFSRSSGTKIILSPSPGTASSDMGIGVESNALWFAVPNATYSTKWYSSSVNTATLTGSGVFTVAGATSQINVDNLRLDGNTISSTNNGGHILLMPSGNGRIGINTTTPGYTLTVNGGISSTQSIECENLYVNSSITLGANGNDGYFFINDINEEVIMEATIYGAYFGVPLSTQSYLSFIPETSASLSSNGQVKFERVSNTGLKIKMRGTDGVTRSITLALS